MNAKIGLDKLDPNKTALVVVHMAKGVAGEVDTPFNRLFRHRAKEKGIITTQQRLLNEFRRAKAKVVYTFVAYQQGLPGVKPNSPLFRTLFDCNCLLQGTPAVEPIGDIAPLPNEPVVRGQGCSGFEGTGLDTILQVAGVDTLVLVASPPPTLNCCWTITRRALGQDVFVRPTRKASCRPARKVRGKRSRKVRGVYRGAATKHASTQLERSVRGSHRAAVRKCRTGGLPCF